MIHVCKKLKCPRRFSIGSENDADHTTYFCTECKEIYFYSEKRTRSFFLFLKVMMFLIFFGVLIYFLLPILNQKSIDNVYNFGIYNDSIAIDEVFYPIIKDSTIQSYTIDMGDGNQFISNVPDSFSYRKPGVYEISFKSPSVDGKKRIIVFDPTKIPKTEYPDTIEETIIIDESNVSINETDIEDVSVSDMPTFDEIKKRNTESSESNNDCPNIGAKCDDKNENTFGDIIRANCECQGIKREIVRVPYYLDQDGDGLVDRNSEKEFEKGNQPTNFFDGQIGFDACPTRYGSKNNKGCPELTLKKSISVKLNESKPLPKINLDIKPTDDIKWTASSGLKLSGDKTLQASIEGVTVGKNTVSISVKGTEDQLYAQASSNVCVEASDTYIINLLDPLMKYGQYDVNNAIPSKIRNDYQKSIEALRSILDGQSKISEEGQMYGPNVESFFISKIGTPGSFVKSITVNSIKYNKSKCMIEKIDVSID